MHPCNYHSWCMDLCDATFATKLLLQLPCAPGAAGSMFSAPDDDVASQCPDPPREMPPTPGPAAVTPSPSSVSLPGGSPAHVKLEASPGSSEGSPLPLPQPPKACAGYPDLDRAVAEADGHVGEERRCFVRQRREPAKKQKLCAICRSDVSAARRDAENDGKGAWFAKLSKDGGPPFIEFMYEYVKAQSSTRRKHSQRHKFDFIQYVEAKRVQSTFRLGYKAWA